MGFNIMDLMNGATRAAVEGVDNYEAITLNLDEIKVTKHNRYSCLLYTSSASVTPGI